MSPAIRKNHQLVLKKEPGTPSASSMDEIELNELDEECEDSIRSQNSFLTSVNHGSELASPTNLTMEIIVNELKNESARPADEDSLESVSMLTSSPRKSEKFVVK